MLDQKQNEIPNRPKFHHYPCLKVESHLFLFESTLRNNACLQSAVRACLWIIITHNMDLIFPSNWNSQQQILVLAETIFLMVLYATKGVLTSANHVPLSSIGFVIATLVNSGQSSSQSWRSDFLGSNPSFVSYQLCNLETVI